MLSTLQDHRNVVCLHGTSPLKCSLIKRAIKYTMSRDQNKQLEMAEN